MTRKHNKIDQLDGMSDRSTLDEEYSSTEHYWKSGRLGRGYQAYIDACDVIKNSDIDEDDKEKEREKILQARKEAFGEGDLYKYYPTWS